MGLRITTTEEYCEECGEVTSHMWWEKLEDNPKASAKAGGCTRHKEDPCPEWAKQKSR